MSGGQLGFLTRLFCTGLKMPVPAGVGCAVKQGKAIVLFSAAV